MTRLLFLGLGLLLVACSGGGGAISDPNAQNNPGPGNPPNVAAQEQQFCDTMKACGKSECSAEQKCFAGLLTPAAFDIYTKCRAAPACSGEDNCLGKAGLEVGGSRATQYSNDCKALSESCKELKDDLCSPVVWAYYGTGDKMTACLSKSCAEVSACMTAAIADITVCKNK